MLAAGCAAGQPAFLNTNISVPGVGQIQAVATGDFNNDGNPDIAVLRTSPGSVSILLGNGDGTFQPGKSTSLGEYLYNILLADFNKDGKLDIFLTDSYTNNAFLLFGNGDGTFRTVPVSFRSCCGQFVTGDFNHDGVPDLVQAPLGGLPEVYLGLGEGTFEFKGIVGGSTAVADFNRDGNEDLFGFAGVQGSVLLGNGDGTFQAPLVFNLPPPDYYYLLEFVGDLNGDGIPDAVFSGSLVPGFSIPEFFIYLGRGDGRFDLVNTISPQFYLDSVELGDFNGDGKPDLFAITSYGSVHDSAQRGRWTVRGRTARDSCRVWNCRPSGACGFQPRWPARRGDSQRIRFNRVDKCHGADSRLYRHAD